MRDGEADVPQFAIAVRVELFDRSPTPTATGADCAAASATTQRTAATGRYPGTQRLRKLMSFFRLARCFRYGDSPAWTRHWRDACLEPAFSAIVGVFGKSKRPENFLQNTIRVASAAIFHETGNFDFKDGASRHASASTTNSRNLRESSASAFLTIRSPRREAISASKSPGCRRDRTRIHRTSRARLRGARRRSTLHALASWR